MTMMTQPTVLPRGRYFPSGLALVAAAELILIALLLRLSNTQVFYPAAIACSLCSVQLGILLINRFSVNTRNVRRIARTAEFSTQAMFITDTHGRIKWNNARFTRLTGFALSEIAGKTFAMVLHGQETDIHSVEKIRDRMRLGLPFEAEILEYDRAGLSLWVSCRGQPIHDNRGQVTHYLVTQIDVTEEHRQSRMIIDSLTGNTVTDSAIATHRVNDLAWQLQSLAENDRDQLQAAVDNLKAGVEDCVRYVPAVRENSKSEA